MNLIYFITDKPGPPQGFFIQSTGSREATLKWTKGDENNLPIMNYTLQYRTDTEIYSDYNGYIAGDAEELTVTGLTPATKYFFQLQAVNALGQYRFYCFTVYVLK